MVIHKVFVRFLQINLKYGLSHLYGHIFMSEHNFMENNKYSK